MSAQDSIPYLQIRVDGICQVTPTHFTKTIQFRDINYQLSDNEDKQAIFDGWCDFLNYFDSSIKFQFSFVNLTALRESFVRAIPLRSDQFESIQRELSKIIEEQQAKGNNGIVKTKYLTFGIDADNIRSAKPPLDAFKLVRAQRDCPDEGFPQGGQIHEGKLEFDGAVEIVEEITPAVENGLLVLVVRELVVDVPELDGFGKVGGRDLTDTVYTDLQVGNAVLCGHFLLICPLCP